MSGWGTQTLEQTSLLVDGFLVAALRGALSMHPDPQSAEDYLRDRLVALADTHDTPEKLDAVLVEAAWSKTGEVVDTR